jgi:hypothetical protein
MICPHCKGEHPIQARFCPSTGKPIAHRKHCSNCGQAVQPDWLVCGFCGSPVGIKPGTASATYAPPRSSYHQAVMPRWVMWTGGGLLAIVVIVLIIAVIFHLPGRLSGRYDAVAEKMPDSTDIYVGINLLELVQTKDSRQLGMLEVPLAMIFNDDMGAFSSLAGGDNMGGLDLQTSLNTALQVALGINLTDDIMPWAGQYAGVGVDVSTNQRGTFSTGESLIIAMEARSPGAADDFLEKLSINLENFHHMEITKHEYQGEWIYTDQNNELSFGRIGQIVAFSPSQDTILSMIENIENKQTLGENPVYRKLVNQAPSGSMARVFIKDMTLADLIYEELDYDMRLFSQLLSSPIATASQGSLISVIVDEDNIKFDTLTAFDAERLINQDMKMVNRQNDTFSRLPEDTLVVIAGNDLGRIWGQWSILAGLGNSYSADIGFNLTRDLFNHLDEEWLISLQPAQEGLLYQSGTPLGFTLVARSNHTRELQQTINSFNGVVMQEGSVQLQSYPFLDGNLYEISDRLGSQGMPVMAYCANDEYLFFGTSARSINNLYDKGHKLIDAPKYQKIKGEISRDLGQTLYLDIEGLLQYIEQTWRITPSDIKDLEPYLQSISAIGAAQGLSSEDILHGELIFVGIPK